MILAHHVQKILVVTFRSNIYGILAFIVFVIDRLLYKLAPVMLGDFLQFYLPSADFFSKLMFSKDSFRNTIRVFNSLDPYQDRHSDVLFWVLTVGKGYQQMTKAATSKERV